MLKIIKMALCKYEVVVLIDALNSKDKINSIKKEVEKIIELYGGKILERDDIGHLETLYEIGSTSNPYFYSLYVELDGLSLKDIRGKISIIPGLVRYKIFKMKPNQKFLKFADLEKELKVLDISNLTKTGLFNEISQARSNQINEKKD